jgi:ribonucleoside-diphosphate reductase alpha chain
MPYPIPEIREKMLGNRKIGLEVMGFANTLVLLGIRYDSDEAVAFAEKLARFIQEKAHGRRSARQRRSLLRRQPARRL